MFPTEVYEYAPLADPSAQIRILKIAFDVKALADHENCDPLTATLKTYNLPKAKLSRTRRLVQFAQLPAFQALSYAWGPPERTRRLFIDNRVLYVTENLYLALRDFQRQSVASAYVWADAVCINQADLAERSAQVLLMGEIYHTAFSVQIWIGPSTVDGKRCFRFVSALAGYSYDDEVPDESSEERLGKAMAIPAAAVLDVAHKFAKSLFDMVDIVDPKAREDKASITHESDGDRKIISRLSKWRPGEKRLQKVQGESFSEMAALIDLILVRQCSWFERMWVVQELGVSDLADIMYGGSSLPWDSFLQVLFYLHYTCKLRLPSIPMLTGLERIRHGWVDSRRFPLHTLIRSCSYRQAADPRDKIYALYGLMGDQMHDLLRPNYAKPVAEIFANTTQYFILQSKSLDPICNWQTQEGRHLPSWVPDYSLDQSKSGVSFVGEYGKTGLFSSSGCAEEGRYDLAAAAPLGVLPVTILCLDSVAVLSPRCPENSGFYTAEQIWSKTILGAAHLFQEDIKDLESGVGVISDAVRKYRTYWELAQPVKSITPPPELADDWTLASAVARHGELELELGKSNQVDCAVMETYLYSLCCGIITPSTRINDDDVAVITKLKVPEVPIASDTDPVWLICDAFENAVKSRVLAVTSKGSICVVPEEAQPGDVVCVMHGCSVPVLLRKTPSATEYLFVGACYMYGFMDGEAIAMQRGGRLVEEKIDIV